MIILWISLFVVCVFLILLGCGLVFHKEPVFSYGWPDIVAGTIITSIGLLLGKLMLNLIFG